MNPTTTNSRYFARPPAAPLCNYVESLWIYTNYAPGYRFERVLPTGTAEIVINLTDDELSCYDAETFERIGTVRGPLLAGPLQSFTVFDTKRKLEIMGATFRPAGVAVLLDLPANELAGHEIPLAECWGSSARSLRDRLAATSNPNRRLDILEAVLRSRLWDRPPLHRAVRAALPAFESLDPAPRVGELADRLGISSRRFIEVFTAQVGIAPKAYGRIRRFQGVIDRVQPLEKINWTNVALDCGYYDQAHLIRDFKEFSGLTPSTYASLRGSLKNHLPVPAEANGFPKT